MTSNFISENGKLIKLDYTNRSITWTIHVKSYFAVRKLIDDDSTTGKVIENYREKRKQDRTQAEEYFNSKSGVLDAFIKGLSENSDKSYDYVQIMIPKDEHRKKLLKRFSKKFFDGSNDFSTHFTKREDTSIVGVDCENAKEFFHYDKPDIHEPLESVHIIDDTIDTGCTLKIFLDKLVLEGFINANTTITATIIYNNYKDSTPKFSLDDYRKMN